MIRSVCECVIVQQRERENHGVNQHEKANLQILRSFDLIVTTSIMQSDNKSRSVRESEQEKEEKTETKGASERGEGTLHMCG